MSFLSVGFIYLYFLTSWIFIPLLVFSLLRYSLLVTALLCLVTAGTAAPAIAEFHHQKKKKKKIKTFFRMRHLNMDVLKEFLNFKRDI